MKNAILTILIVAFVVSVTVPDSFGESETPLLILAAMNGDEKQVKEMISAGVDVNTKGKDGETALMRAAMKGRVEIVKYLIQKSADVNATDIEGISALDLAEKNGHGRIVKILENAGAQKANKNNAKENDPNACKAVKMALADFAIYQEGLFTLERRYADDTSDFEMDREALEFKVNLAVIDSASDRFIAKAWSPTCQDDRGESVVYIWDSGKGGLQATTPIN